MGRQIIAIDIGSNYLKGVKAISKRQGLEINGFSAIYLAKDALHQGEIIEENVFITALQEMLKQIKFKKGPLNITISGEKSVSRTLEVVKMSDAELREAIPWELEQNLPFPIENAYFDYIVKKQFVNDEGQEMLDLLIVLMPKQVIEGYLSSFSKMNLKLKTIDLQPFALYNAYSYHCQVDEVVALIDIGASTSDIVIVDNKDLYLNRTIAIGGANFTEMIASHHNFSFEEAEMYKTRNQNSAELADLLSLNYEELVNEISRSIIHFQIQNRGKTVQKIYLSGGGSKTLGLIDYLTEKSEQPLELIKPLSDLSFNKNLDQNSLLQLEPEFTVASGLLFRGVIAND